GSKKEMARMALPVKEGEEYLVRIEDKQYNNPADGITRIKGYIIIIKEGGSLLDEEVMVKITDVSRTFARAVML
ncbi:MAG TPA: TRAM domain-containing protein, partial [Halanaerobiales bacterium]|nr:TRAM domain-containing protein [Halanaerobiales bacterium]